MKLLFIEYPEKIECYDFRGNRRVECYLPAFVRILERRIEGSITDISKAGCLLDIKMPDFEDCKNLFDNNEEIDIVFQLPGINEALNANSKHTTLKEEPDKVSIGLESVYMANRYTTHPLALLLKANK